MASYPDRTVPCRECKQPTHFPHGSRGVYCRTCAKRRQGMGSQCIDVALPPDLVRSYLDRAVARETAMPWERAQ